MNRVQHFLFPFRPLACPLFPCCDYMITWFNHVFNWQIVQSSIIFGVAGCCVRISERGFAPAPVYAFPGWLGCLPECEGTQTLIDQTARCAVWSRSVSLCLLCRFSALLQIAGLRLSDLCRNVERQKNNKLILEIHGKHSILSLYILFIFCYLMSMNMIHMGKDVLCMPPRGRLPPAISPDSVYIPRRIIPLKDETALSVFGLDAHSILHSRPARKVTFSEQVVIDGWED